MKSFSKEIAIPNPCNADWDLMEKRDRDNFCNQCSKSVIDFTKYSDAEIINLLSVSASKICGRLSETQLRRLNYQLIVPPAGNNWIKYLGVLAIGASIFVSDAHATVFKPSITIAKSLAVDSSEAPSKVVKKITGYVLDGNNKPVVGLRLVLHNTKLFASTDKNGRYEIILPDGFDTKKKFLIVESSRYSGDLIVNFTIAKQKNLMVTFINKMIMGEILIRPKR